MKYEKKWSRFAGARYMLGIKINGLKFKRKKKAK